jgi:hypothetical protein
MVRRNSVLSAVSVSLLFLAPSNLSAVSLFGATKTYQTGAAGTDSVAIGDLNGDGKPDIVALSNVYGTFAVLLNNGDGTFQSPVTYNAGLAPKAVVVADVNNDGKLDVIVADQECPTPSGYDSCVAVLLGNGDGTFQPMKSYSSGYSTRNIAVGDFNHDGNLDLVVGNECVNAACNISGNAVVVLLGDGSGAFNEGNSYSVSSNQYSIAVADVNGDGKLDVLVANGYVNVLLGNGDGTFQPAQEITSDTLGVISIAAADVNGDGKIDLVAANTNNGVPPATVSVFLGNGNGTFQSPQTFNSGAANLSAVAIADVNGDGKPDVLVIEFLRDSAGLLGVLLGNGDGTFQAPITRGSGGDTPLAMAVADLNGDGLPDVVIGNNGPLTAGAGTVDVLLHKRYQSSTTVSSSLNPSTAGQVVTFTATVTVKINGVPTGGTASGTVTFKSNGIALGTVTLTNNTAKFSTSALKTGTDYIRAVYNGNAGTGSSTSAPLTQVVNP